MAYEKQNFVDGEVLNAEQMNHIEDGIVANETSISNLNDTVYGEETINTFINQGTSSTVATVNYCFFFDSEDGVKVHSFLPSFAEASSETFEWGLYLLEDVPGENVYGDKVMGGISNVNEPVLLDTLMTKKHVFAVINAAGTYIKYNSSNPQIGARICSVVTHIGNRCHVQQVAPLRNFRFAGTFEIAEGGTALLTKPVADSLYISKEVFDNFLFDKKIMAIGDSMTKGHSLADDKVWLSLLAKRNHMTKTNNGTNGAFMIEREYNSAKNSVYHKVCDSTSPLYISDADISSQDYIIIFAGTNDINNSVELGSEDSTDTTTFYGALNAICTTLQTRAPKAHIGFITPYLRNGIEARCKTYIEALKNVCGKYSIPVYDNASNGGVCWSNDAIKNALTLGDGLHLNTDGMVYASSKYENFVRSI